MEDAGADLLLGHRGVPAGFHASWEEARAVAAHPVLYPTDLLALELTRAVDAEVALALGMPENQQLVLRVLQAAREAGDVELAVFAAVAASLGGTSLDGLELPADLQEQVSFAAASFRALHRPLGGLHGHPEAEEAWLRASWTSRLTGAQADRLAELADPSVQAGLLRRRALDERLFGRTAAWTVAPQAVGLARAPGGLVGAAEKALTSLDSGRARTRAIGSSVGVVGSVQPAVTVEPGPFWQACVEAVDRFPVERRPESLRDLCARGAVQVQLDQGGVESNTHGWQSPALPAFEPLVLPLSWTREGGYEGLALVGVRTLDVVVRYRTPPVVTRDGEVVRVDTGEAVRTLLLPAWLPLRLPAVPDPAWLAARREGRTEAELRALLDPETRNSPCGCAHPRDGAPFRWLLGLVSRH